MDFKPTHCARRYFTRSFAPLVLLGALHLGFPTAGSAQATGADPRLGAWVGSWTLVSAQASLEPANRLVIASVPNGLHVAMTGETHFDFTANSSGHQSPAPGNLGFNQIELHRVDKRQAEVKEEKDGAVVATVREKLSNDGNELTTTTATRGQANKITVWTRSGGVKDSKDLFAGEWTQDQSKTRLRQGLAVKIEPDGRGGVRFLSDFTYDARFDGKRSDVQGSRNDSVSLELVDARTVDAIYRRDDQVTQKDRWTVSADGLQMLDSSMSTLETGQHLTEKLVFKRQ